MLNLKIVPLFVAMAVFAFLLVACTEQLPSPQGTPDPDATIAAVIETVNPTKTSTPEPTGTLEPRTPDIQATIDAAVKAATSAETANSQSAGAQFDAERTRQAPTLVAAVTLAPVLVDKKGQHLQWELLTSAATAEQRTSNGLVGFKNVNDGNGQYYSCAIYLYEEIPRINLVFVKDLRYSIVVNQYGELQGAVEATTLVNGVAIPVEWRTWASRTDHIRLREEDAVRLVEELRASDAKEFRLELHDDPELSATYDVTNLLDALAANEMACFTSQ